ncbi:MAG: hypothetical protein ACEQSR_11035 [Candidatus Methylacidiphilales bacterium]
MNKNILGLVKHLFYGSLIVLLFTGAKPQKIDSSILKVLHFKYKSNYLDSSRLNEYYTLIKYLNKPEFAAGYKITFSPYISKSEFLFDKKIAIKRYHYLQKLFKRDLKTSYQIKYKNVIDYVSENDSLFDLTGLFYSLSYRK